MAQAGGYQVRLPLSLSLRELREQVGVVRTGLVRLIARFEPDRMHQVERFVDTFGERETLARIRDAGDPVASVPVDRPTGRSATTVH